MKNPTFNRARFGKQAFSRALKSPATAAFALLTAAGFLPGAHAQAPASWKLAASEPLPAPAEGVTHTCQTVQETTGAEGLLGPKKATLHFVCFNAHRHTLRVLDQSTMGRDNLGEVMQKNHCVAGANGGYFQADFEPVGLVISDGRLRQPPAGLAARPHGRAGGYPQPHLHSAAPTNRCPAKTPARPLQAGPFLVDDGKPVPGLNNARSARRTAVMTDGQGEWALVSSSSVTLAEFGAILSDPALTPGDMKIRRALNLDGGSSTALWTRPPAQPIRSTFPSSASCATSSASCRAEGAPCAAFHEGSGSPPARRGGSRGLYFQVGVVHGHRSELGEAVLDLLRLADDDDRRAVQIDVFAREAFDLLRADAADPARVVLEIIRRQAVQVDGLHALGRAWRGFPDSADNCPAGTGAACPSSGVGHRLGSGCAGSR